MHPTLDQLQAFGRGEINEPDASSIEEHLAVCSSCQDRLEQSSSDDPLVRLIRSSDHATRNNPPAVTPVIVPTGYELLAPIGRGGMGVVYKARQRGLGRLVALKHIRAGLDADGRDLSRFRTEAESAARLKHPNIVAVYDIGRQDGMPYLAMELVEGGSLADRLASGPMRPRELAVLMEAIALGVEHAHRAGVIHRDLKPANILLTPEGVPKVADFGLAKQSDATLSLGGATQSGALLGTPRYMAPEQADGREAGPAADLHALGVILYEGLTGRPPYQAATPIETLEQVRNLEAPSPRRLQPGLPRDLQTICLKCLEKDPSRRYASAGALAEDLGRFLRGEPILARPAGLPERAVKWVRRRPYQAGLVALGICSLIGAFAGLFAHNARLNQEIQRANRHATEAGRQKALADANYREARAALQKLLGWVDDPAFAAFPGRDRLHRAQLEQALAFYDTVLAAADSPDPMVRFDTAQAAREAANLQITLGQRENGRRTLEKALRLLDGVRPADVGKIELWAEQVRCLVKLGVAHMDDDRGTALRVLEQAQEIATRIAREAPERAGNRGDLAWCEHNIGIVLFLMGKHEESRPHFQRAADLYRALARESPDDPNPSWELAGTLTQIAQLDLNAGRLDEAEPVFQEAAELFEAAVKDGSGSRSAQYTYTQFCIAWGNLALARKQSEVAVGRYSRGVKLVEAMLAAEPNLAMFQTTAVALHGSLGNALGPSLHRYGEAAAEMSRVIELEKNPDERLRFRLLRALWLIKTPESARALAEVESLVRDADTAKQAIPPEFQYHIGGVYAATSALSRDATHAATALTWLRRAAASGFFKEAENIKYLDQDENMNSLHDRPDYKEFRAALPGPSPTGEPRDGP